MWGLWSLFGVLVVCVLFKSHYNWIGEGVEEKEGFADVGDQMRQSAVGVRNDCLIAEEDAHMKRLHRNMWMRGGTKVDEAANYTAQLIGQEINEDTDKAQKRLIAAARKAALA